MAQSGLFAFERIKLRDGSISFAKVTAKDSVDETGLRAEAELPGEFDHFVDGGVVGNSFEPEDLIEPEAEENLQRLLLCSAFGFFGNQPVEGGLPANDAKGEFLGEAAVDWREGGGSKGVVEQFLDKTSAFGVAAKDAHGNFSWFFRTHCLIMCRRRGNESLTFFGAGLKSVTRYQLPTRFL